MASFATSVPHVMGFLPPARYLNTPLLTQSKPQGLRVGRAAAPLPGRSRPSPAGSAPPARGKGGKRPPAAARRVAGKRLPPSAASGARSGPCSPRPILKGRGRLRGKPGHRKAGGASSISGRYPPPPHTSAAVTGRGAHWAPNDRSPQGRAAMPAPEPAPGSLPAAAASPVPDSSSFLSNFLIMSPPAATSLPSSCTAAGDPAGRPASPLHTLPADWVARCHSTP